MNAFLGKRIDILLTKFQNFQDVRQQKRVIYNYNELPSQTSSKKSLPAEKKALLSYLVQPLLPPKNERDTATFSNIGIAQYIPRALNELGYSVDIINYDNKKFVPRTNYAIFIGHGGINFELIEKNLDPSCTKIYFSTGIYWEEWNKLENDRLLALYKRKREILPPDRLIKEDEEYANVHADGIICLGNVHAKNTYSKFPNVICINNAVYPDDYFQKKKDFLKGSRNFLFFNGPGNVHKGLDLLLEAFGQIEHHLYIRQDIDPKFFELYKKELTEYPNIHLVPYLKKNSNEFFDLMDNCNFVISPTCAEGQPGSIIECMAHGLIPILSKEANIDTKNFGITLKDNSIEEIIAVVKEVSQKPMDWYQNRSSLTLREVHNFYTPEIFLENFKNAISFIVEKTSTIDFLNTVGD